VSPLMVRDLSAVGRTVEKAVVRWSRVLVSVVPACPIGNAMKSTLPQYRLRAAIRGRGEVRVLLVELIFAAEVSAYADLDDDEGALLSVEGGRIGNGGVWDPSYIDEVWGCAMPGLK
jgi:hypothetical protein